MSESHPRLVICAALASVLSHTAPGLALDKDECVAAYEQAQLLRNRLSFRAAKEQLLLCVQVDCPKFISRDCAHWLSDLDTSTPTVIINARDGQGRELTAVHVKADGVPLLDGLDGKAIAIDPGTHVFHFERATMEPFQERYVIRQGERNRVIKVVLRSRDEARTVTAGSLSDSPPAPRVDSQPGPSKTPGIAVGAFGLLALGSFTYFGLTGRAEVDRLRSECAPHCNQSDVDSAQRTLLVADASLGVGIVSLGIASWLLFSKGQRPQNEPPAQVSIRPTTHGGAAEVAVRF
jgi:hypothetical protein